jgi:magnesium transporter
MSAASTEDDAPKTALKVADLSPLDRALKKDDAALKAALDRLRPADVGRDLTRRTIDTGKRIVEVAGERNGALILRAAHAGVAATIIAAMEPAHAETILSYLTTERRVAIVTLLEPSDRVKLEAHFDEGRRTRLARRLALPVHAIGRLVTPATWTCGVAATVAEAMAVLAERNDKIEVASNCYVLDDDRHVAGVVALRTLAVAPRDAKVADLMGRDVVTVQETDEVAAAAEIVRAHNFLSLPIVDAEQRFLGAVRVDDLLDTALAKVSADILNQGAVASKATAAIPYFQTSILRVVRSRVTWLVLLFVAETATGTVLRAFEDELARVVALSFFIPLLIGTGGNAGSQTVSTIIRALALGEVRVGDVLRVIGKEVTTGLLLGLLLGGVAFFRAQMWGVDMHLAACVAITILVVCTWANLVGSLIPILAQRLKIDPTVVSAPMITTLVDASGLALYLGIAHVMIPELSAAG